MKDVKNMKGKQQPSVSVRDQRPEGWPTSRPGLGWVWKQIGRLDLAAGLLVAVAVLVALGSCFPQLSPQVEDHPERLARWQAGVWARYGRLADLLAAAGAFRCFSGPVLVALVVLATATGLCTLRRWPGLWRGAFRSRVRCSAIALETAPYTARFTVPGPDPASAVGETLAHWGFRVRSEVDGPGGNTTLRGDRGRLVPLATLVTHLAVVLVVVGLALSTAFSWQESFTVGPGEAARVARGGGLAVTVEDFTIHRYADGSVAGYEARVTAGGERGSKQGTLRVNQPMAYGRVRLYLQATAETSDGTRITLSARQDPGAGPAILGGWLLVLGMVLTIVSPHVWVQARIGPDGTGRVAGRCSPWAWGFGREFEALVGEMRAGGTG